MRLINTVTFEIEEFFGETPPYAILSHTWEPRGEVLLADMLHPELARKKPGFGKIAKTCSQARLDGLEWAWVDTCCIDKTSSAELTEAINSMFRWYAAAAVCYAYIADLGPHDDFKEGLRRCRWVTRGWTLQELIAPAHVYFFDSSWNLRGDKREHRALLSDITGIDFSTLSFGHMVVGSVPVARRMSWASRRTTTRVEDMAYCLLGIFDVNMPMLYGEGEKAFTRLQQEIVKSSNDLSLFAWKSNPPSNPGSALKSHLEKTNGPMPYTGIFASRPSQFSHAHMLRLGMDLQFNSEFSVTNMGLRLPNLLRVLPYNTPRSECYILPLNCHMVSESNGQPGPTLGIFLVQYGPSLFARRYSWELCELPPTNPDPFGYPKAVTVAEPLYISAQNFGISQCVSIAKAREGALRLKLPLPFINDHLTVKAEPLELYDQHHRLFLIRGHARLRCRWIIYLPRRPGEDMSEIHVLAIHDAAAGGRPRISVMDWSKESLVRSGRQKRDHISLELAEHRASHAGFPRRTTSVYHDTPVEIQISQRFTTYKEHRSGGLGGSDKAAAAAAGPKPKGGKPREDDGAEAKAAHHNKDKDKDNAGNVDSWAVHIISLEVSPLKQVESSAIEESLSSESGSAKT